MPVIWVVPPTNQPQMPSKTAIRDDEIRKLISPAREVLAKVYVESESELQQIEKSRVNLSEEVASLRAALEEKENTLAQLEAEIVELQEVCGERKQALDCADKIRTLVGAEEE